MPRAEEGNIGNQSECTSLVREHSRRKISSDAFIVEGGYSKNRKVHHRAPAPADNILVIQDLSSPSMTLFCHSHSPTSSWHCGDEGQKPWLASWGKRGKNAAWRNTEKNHSGTSTEPVSPLLAFYLHRPKVLPLSEVLTFDHYSKLGLRKRTESSFWACIFFSLTKVTTEHFIIWK